MKRYRNLAVAAICVALCATILLNATTTGKASVGSFAVKIDLPDRHGSGAHIGRGYILTAAHVVETGTPKVITDDGSEYETEVLWINKDYDIALLHVENYERIAFKPLACSDLSVGTDYTVYGNPGSIEFISSSGTVVGKHEKRGPWKEVVTIDGTVVMGMSGGALVHRNQVVGIAVGVQTVPMGFSSSLTGFGFAVPGRAICDLMGRI